MHSGKEDALLKKQKEKAEAEMCAWVEEAHRECQERDRDEAERRARNAARKAEKKKKEQKPKVICQVWVLDSSWEQNRAQSFFEVYKGEAF